jgi:hypothetical protein
MQSIFFILSITITIGFKKKKQKRLRLRLWLRNHDYLIAIESSRLPISGLIRVIITNGSVLDVDLFCFFCVKKFGFFSRQY